MGRKFMLLALSVSLAMVFAGVAFAGEDIKHKPSCNYCGMDRQKFDFSRMLIGYSDGTKVGLCSLHCAAVDLALNIDKTPSSIKVADYESKELIDAETAHWVLGGDVPGVMSMRAKWAFADKKAARAFAKTHKGKVTVFEKAMHAAYEDMYKDTMMIRAKRTGMKEHKHMEHKHEMKEHKMEEQPMEKMEQKK